MGLIHTKINDIQDTHLIRHEEITIANSSAIYSGLGWHIITNLGTEVINHAGRIMVTLVLLDLIRLSKQDY